MTDRHRGRGIGIRDGFPDVGTGEHIQAGLKEKILITIISKYIQGEGEGR
jgi:hypothetical protein